MLRSFRTLWVLLAIFGVAGLNACSSDSLVAPAQLSPSQTAVMTISTNEIGAKNYSTGIHTGLNPIDSSEWQLNLDRVADDTRSSHSFLARAGTKFPLALIPYGTGGSESDGVTKATYSFATDWAPVDAGKHPGIKIESSSELLLMVTEYSRANSSLSFLKTTFEKRNTPSAFVNIKKEFAADKNVGHFVVTRRIYTMTCVSNDSVTFASNMGVIEQSSRSDGVVASTVVPQRVYRVQVKCGLYADISAARIANPSISQ